MFTLSLKKNDEESVLIEDLFQGGIKRQLAEKRIYEHFFYLIRMGIRKYKLDEEACASVYSDTIISVIDNVLSKRFEGRSSLKSYTHQIFMNKCVDVLRKKTTKKNAVDYNTDIVDALVYILPDKARNIVQQLIEKSDRSLLLESVQGLGEKCRELLLLFEDGYSDQEIAMQMNYNSPDVVKTTRLRCLDKLREKYMAKL